MNRIVKQLVFIVYFTIKKIWLAFEWNYICSISLLLFCFKMQICWCLMFGSPAYPNSYHKWDDVRHHIKHTCLNSKLSFNLVKMAKTSLLQLRVTFCWCILNSLNALNIIKEFSKDETENVQTVPFVPAPNLDGTILNEVWNSKEKRCNFFGFLFLVYLSLNCVAIFQYIFDFHLKVTWTKKNTFFRSTLGIWQIFTSKGFVVIFEIKMAYFLRR